LFFEQLLKTERDVQEGLTAMPRLEKTDKCVGKKGVRFDRIHPFTKIGKGAKPTEFGSFSLATDYVADVLV